MVQNVANPGQFSFTEQPVGPLGIIAMPGCEVLGERIDQYLKNWRQGIGETSEEYRSFPGYHRDSFLLPVKCPRFGTGEGKGLLNQSVRGYDIYIITDVTAHQIKYEMYGQSVPMSPDDHYADLKRVIAAHDVGRAINPVSLVGQVEGGVVMSLGYALTEQYPLEKGKPLAKFGTLGLFKAPDVPEIETIIVEGSNSPLAFGAKGIGEITSIPTAPAVQLAYYNCDGKFRTELPLEDTPYSRRKK